MGRVECDRGPARWRGKHDIIVFQPSVRSLPEDEPGQWVQGEVLQLQEDGGQGEAGQDQGGEACWMKDKLKRVSAAESHSSLSSSPSSEWDILDKERVGEKEVQGKPVMAVTENQNDEGYTKLEEFPRDFPYPEGSGCDLREWSGQENSGCCSCSIM